MPDPQIIPTMTTNTAPSGVASALTIYSAGYEAYRAFDNSTSTIWHSAASSTSWVQYQFTGLVNVTAYSFSNYYGYWMTTALTLSGSLDGVTFNTIDNRTGLSLSYNTLYTYSVAECSYIYFRLQVANASYNVVTSFGLYGTIPANTACYIAGGRRNRLNTKGVSTYNALA